MGHAHILPRYGVPTSSVPPTGVLIGIASVGGFVVVSMLATTMKVVADLIQGLISASDISQF